MNAPLSLIVFALDFTLWECGGQRLDCAKPPFTLNPKGKIHDSEDRLLRLYPDVPKIFEQIDAMGYRTAIACRTIRIAWARDLLELMDFRDRFDYEEIFPASKVLHFTVLKRNSGIPFQEMLYFDDDPGNIAEVKALGVKCVQVRRGITLRAFEKGMDLF